jgi:hypothetical protein
MGTNKMKLFIPLCALLFFTQNHPVIFTAGIWRATASDHTVIGFGDCHIKAPCTHAQQYEIIKGALAIPHAHLIVEDSKATIPLYRRPLYLYFEDKQLLNDFHGFARAHCLRSTNIECRPCELLIPRVLRAAKMIQCYDKIKTIENDYKDYNQKILQNFEQKTLPLLTSYSSLNMNNYKIMNDHNTYNLLSGPLSSLVDLNILDQICTDQIKNDTSIIVAGAAHLVNVAQTMEQNGYDCISYTVNNAPAARELEPLALEVITSTDIPTIYATAHKKCSLPTASLTTSSQLALGVMRYKAFAEKNRFLHFTNNMINISTKTACLFSLVTGLLYLEALAITHAL